MKINRYMLITISLIIIAIAIYYVIINNNSYSTQNSIICNNLYINNLNAQQINNAIAIVNNDSIVKGYINDVQRGSPITLDSPISYSYKEIYSIGNVSISQVHEVSPGIDRIRFLPAVELIFGNKSYGGLNLYIFVDTDTNRVVYIGALNRSGPFDGRHFYSTSPLENGVIGTIIDNTSSSIYYENLTIVDTGCQQLLTDLDKSNIYNIINNNTTIKNIKSMAIKQNLSYEESIITKKDFGEINLKSYIIVNPVYQILIYKSDKRTYDKQLQLIIDNKNKTILSINEYVFNYSQI